MDDEYRKDMRQYVSLKRLTGRKASRRQLEIDFMREMFGDSRSTDSTDAFKHRQSFEYDREDKTVDRFSKFIDAMQDLTLAQRIIACLLFCGLTIEDIKNLTGLKNNRSFYYILRER